MEVEKVNKNVHKNLAYIQHRLVVRVSIVTTKAGIVYDASTKSDIDSVSLNGFLK